MITQTKPKSTAEIVKELNLKHIAIIMDGNRRWAKERNLPSTLGHQRGVKALKDTVYACNKFGIEYLTVYAFSTENWNRTQEEVHFLMGLLAKTIEGELEELHENNVCINFIGNIGYLDVKLQKVLNNAVEVTKNNTGVKLQIAFNYGSRDEIVRAVKLVCEKVKNEELDVENIDENTVSQYLYTSSIPDPDLLIRTGGEKRISNYLLWQIAYSEVLVVDKYWPEFGELELASAVMEFQNRTRRFGK